MRVIAGTARGRRLKEIQGRDVRPTTDRVKEGLFSAIQFDIEGRRALDLFAGTGQLGVECLSRGAAEAVFVDRDAASLETVRENLRRTGFQDRARLVHGDALSFLERTRERFDLIFLDPPYGAGLLEEAARRAAAFDILNPHGIIVAEYPAGRGLSVPAYRVRRTYRYGKIAVTLLCRAPAGGPQAEDEDETT